MSNKTLSTSITLKSYQSLVFCGGSENGFDQDNEEYGYANHMSLHDAILVAHSLDETTLTLRFLIGDLFHGYQYATLQYEGVTSVGKFDLEEHWNPLVDESYFDRIYLGSSSVRHRIMFWEHAMLDIKADSVTCTERVHTTGNDRELAFNRPAQINE